MALRVSVSFKENNDTEKEMYSRLNNMIDRSIYIKKAIKFYMDYEDEKLNVISKPVEFKKEEDNKVIEKVSKLDLSKML